MTNIWQPSGDPDVAERRIHYRQKLSSSRVELGEENEGVVLNISQSGLALQTDQELLDDELPKMRFQLSESEAWIEAKGRVKWRNDAKRTAGVEFVDLSAATRKQIEILIFLSYETEFKHENKPVGETEEIRTAGTGWEGIEALPFPVEFEKRGETPSVSASQAYCEEEERVSERDLDADATGNSDEVIHEAHSELEFISPMQIPEERQSLETKGESTGPANDEDVSSEAFSEEQKKAELLAEAKFSVKKHIPPIKGSWQAANVIPSARNAERRVVLLLGAALVLLGFISVRRYLQRTATSQAEKEVTEATLPVPAAARISEPALGPEIALRVPKVTSPVSHAAFGLQLGAMAQEGNAQELARSLKQINFTPIVTKSSSDHLYRVVVGPYDGADTAGRVKEQLEKRGFQAFRIKWIQTASDGRRLH